MFTGSSRETIAKIKKVIKSGLIKSQEKRAVNALKNCTEFRDHIVVLGSVNGAVNLMRHLCLCEADEDNKSLLPPVVVLTLSSDSKEAENMRRLHEIESSGKGSKYLNSVCAGLIHGVVGSVDDLMLSGAPYASMVVLLSSREIEMSEGYHVDGMGIRTTLLIRSECKKLQVTEPYIMTELFNSANTIFVDPTDWGGSNSNKQSHYTLSPVFSEGRIYTNELNDTLLGMSYYVPRMAECLVQMIDGPSKLRHYDVPSEFVGRSYIEIVRYLQSHATTAVAIVSQGLAIGVEQRSHNDVSMRTALTLWKMVCSKKCCRDSSSRSSNNSMNRLTSDQDVDHHHKKKSKGSIQHTKQSWSRMELLTLSENDFNNTKHQCVITCPPDNRVLTLGDKILVLRPFEESPVVLKLGCNSFRGERNKISFTEKDKESNDEFNDESNDDSYGNGHLTPPDLLPLAERGKKKMNGNLEVDDLDDLTRWLDETK